MSPRLLDLLKSTFTQIQLENEVERKKLFFHLLALNLMFCEISKSFLYKIALDDNNFVPNAIVSSSP
jgi:hypothetical protein